MKYEQGVATCWVVALLKRTHIFLNMVLSRKSFERGLMLRIERNISYISSHLANSPFSFSEKCSAIELITEIWCSRLKFFNTPNITTGSILDLVFFLFFTGNNSKLRKTLKCACTMDVPDFNLGWDPRPLVLAVVFGVAAIAFERWWFKDAHIKCKRS